MPVHIHLKIERADGCAPCRAWAGERAKERMRFREGILLEVGTHLAATEPTARGSGVPLVSSDVSLPPVSFTNDLGRCIGQHDTERMKPVWKRSRVLLTVVSLRINIDEDGQRIVEPLAHLV